MDESTELAMVDDEGTDVIDALNPINNAKLAQMRKAAMLAYAGSNLVEVGEQLGVAAATVSKWLKSAFCIDLLNKFHNSDREAVKDQLRQVLPDMCETLINDIRDNTDFKYKAIDKVCKIFELSGKQEKTDGISAYKDLVDTLFGEEDDEDELKVTVTVEKEA